MRLWARAPVEVGHAAVDGLANGGEDERRQREIADGAVELSPLVVAHPHAWLAKGQQVCHRRDVNVVVLVDSVAMHAVVRGESTHDARARAAPRLGDLDVDEVGRWRRGRAVDEGRSARARADDSRRSGRVWRLVEADGEQSGGGCAQRSEWQQQGGSQAGRAH